MTQDNDPFRDLYDKNGIAYEDDPFRSLYEKNGIAYEDGFSLKQEVKDKAASFGGEFVGLFGSGLSGMGDLYNAAGRSLARPVEAGLDALGLDGAKKALKTPIPESVAAWTNPGTILKNAGEPLKDIASDMRVPEERRDFLDDVFGGLGQLAGQIATYGVTGGTGNVALMAGQGASIQSDRAREEGKYGTPEGDTALALGAGTTALTEKIGLEKLLSRVPPSLKNRFSKYAADIGIAAGVEASQEFIEGVTQNLVSMYFLEEPPKDKSELVERAVAGTGYEALVAGNVGGLGRALVLGASRGKAYPSVQPERQETQVESIDIAPDNVSESDVTSNISTDAIALGRELQEKAIKGEPFDDDVAAQEKTAEPGREAQTALERWTELRDDETGEIIGRYNETTGVSELFENDTSQVKEQAQDLENTRPEPAVEQGPIKPPSVQDQDQQDVAELRITKEDVADPQTDTVLLDPDSIQADAEKFQFKQGGDADGVTPALKGVKKWNNDYAGVSLVWERADGERFIVDGHQRLGLAKKLKAQGQDDVLVRARILREADGVSANDAMLEGAWKNLAEGGETTKSLDVAKVIRNSNDPKKTVNGIKDVIPPRRKAFGEGVALARLGDDAWTMVVNDVVPAGYGAEVAQKIQDGQEQAAALEYLNKADIRNAEELRLVVDQLAQAGFEKTQGDQTSLFGDDGGAAPLMVERARVIANTSKYLRGMKKVFKAALDGESVLAEAGNILNKETNKAKLSENELTALKLEKLATVKGPVSDAVTEAAKAVKAGKPVAVARKVVLDVLRNQGTDVEKSTEPGAYIEGRAENVGRKTSPDVRESTQGHRIPGTPESQIQVDEQQALVFEAEREKFRRSPPKKSKAVDEAAEPLVPYHGSVQDNGQQDSDPDDDRILYQRRGQAKLVAADFLSKSRSNSGRSQEASDTSDVMPQVENVKSALSKRLEILGLGDKVNLNIVDQIRSMQTGEAVDADGVYRGNERLIEVAMNAENSEYTLNHEAVHALRDMGLFLDGEWKVLERKAQKDADLMRRIKETYPDLNENDLIEEAVAELYAGYRKGAETRGLARRAFKKVSAFVEALGNALRGAGFQTAAQVMGKVDDGTVGRRDGPDGYRSTKKDKFQRRPATDPSLFGTSFAQPSQSLVEVFSERQLPLWQKLKSSTSPKVLGETLDRVRIKLQDHLLPLKRLQQAIEKQTGKPLPEKLDTYMNETLMTGRIGAKLEKLLDGQIKPVLETMTKFGITMDEMSDYMMARHAKERNAYINEINPAFDPGTGSGMTDAEADAVIEDVRSSGKKLKYDTVAARLDKIIDASLQLRVDEGLMSEGEAMGLRRRWKHYVPLRGKAGEIDPLVSLDIDRPAKQSGLSVGGKEHKQALGRESRAENVLPYIFMQAQEAIIRSETNRVAQSFYGLASANPDPDMWTVDKIESRPYLDRKTGQVKYRVTKDLSAEDRDLTVTTKVDGTEYRITMNGDNPAAVRLARGMRNLGAQDTNALVNGFGRINRYLSSMSTSFNPEFVFSNAFRDAQTGIAALQMQDIKGLTRQAVSEYVALIKSAVTLKQFKKDSEYRQWYEEFKDNGGRTYFNKVDNVADVASELQSMIDEMNPETDGPAKTVRKTAKALLHGVEKVNLAVESHTRLAAYIALRKKGVSAKKAASVAKELTVNFNRKGEWGNAMNSLYLFYNASVQGAMIPINMLKKKGSRRAAGLIMAAGFMLEMMAQLISGEDDDGRKHHDKIKEHVKSRNWIVTYGPGEGDNMAIPMPYGLDVFAHMGRGVAEAMTTKKPATQISAEIMNTFISSFNPMGGTNPFGQDDDATANKEAIATVMPTIGDPFVELAFNRDFAGRRIMPEENPFGPQGKPDHLRKFDRVSPTMDAIATALDRSTGGDGVVPGDIDISPETIEHLTRFVTGGAGDFIKRVIDLPLKAADPEYDMSLNDVPLMRKFAGKSGKYSAKSDFYEAFEDIRMRADQLDTYLENGEKKSAAQFGRKYRGLLALEVSSKTTKKLLKDIRNSRDRSRNAYGEGRISRAKFVELVELYKSREDKLITQFMARYNTAKVD